MLEYLVTTYGVNSSGMGTQIISYETKKSYAIDFGVKYKWEKSVKLLTHHHCDHDKYVPKDAIMGDTENVKSFKVPHAKIGTYGYIIEDRVLFLTDCCGSPDLKKLLPQQDFSKIRLCIIELNHDGHIADWELKHSYSAKEHMSHIHAINMLYLAGIKQDTTIIYTHVSHDNMTETALEEFKCYYPNVLEAKENKKFVLKLEE